MSEQQNVSEEKVSEEPTVVEGEAAKESTISVVDETVHNTVEQLQNLTIFGNKSLDELHKIQSKRSHLSAGIWKLLLFIDTLLIIFANLGILFTDPALKM